MSPTFTADRVDVPSVAGARVTAAQAEAGRNLSANLAALRATQPWVAERIVVFPPSDLEWVYGRDGALTALRTGGTWWADCSVPRAAAGAMLRTLDVRGVCACFLAPFHAAALRVALDRLRPEQAIVAVVPDERVLSVHLSCDDFSRDIKEHRLWLAAGRDWPADMDRLLTGRPGLPTPGQFIRLADGCADAADALIEPVQRIFSEHANRRSARIDALRLAPRAAVRQGGAVVVAPSRFRLWDDAGPILAGIAEAMDWTIVDTDDPASAAPVHLAERIAAAGALMTANLTRADLPGVAPLDVPWVAWLTSPRIPSFDQAGPRDQVLLADERWAPLARAQRWPADRVHVAGWPALIADDDEATPSAPVVAMLSDVPPSLEPPRQVIELSSQRLLWDFVRDELTTNPFAVGGDPLRYLRDRMRRGSIAEEALDAAAFIDRLIVPAFARGLAAVIAGAGVPLQLHGSGWDAIDGLGRFATGPVRDRDTFARAVGTATVLVHAWPTGDVHAIDACGRPVIRGTGDRRAFLDGLRRAATAAAVVRPAKPHPTAMAPSLSPELLRRILRL